jgi:hypothetical protein
LKIRFDFLKELTEMRKKSFFALALMAVLCLGGLLFESAAAGQNTNSSTTMNKNMGATTNRSSGRRHGRRHRRHRRASKTGNANNH